MTNEAGIERGGRRINPETGEVQAGLFPPTREGTIARARSSATVELGQLAERLKVCAKRANGRRDATAYVALQEVTIDGLRALQDEVRRDANATHRHVDQIVECLERVGALTGGELR